jgi:hypothetical protein
MAARNSDLRSAPTEARQLQARFPKFMVSKPNAQMACSGHKLELDSGHARMGAIPPSEVVSYNLPDAWPSGESDTVYCNTNVADFVIQAPNKRIRYV